LELYHSINSVCAKKVRIALKEKGQEAKDQIMALRGDQFDPAYLALNPNGVVPTLVHDGKPIIEPSLILYYIRRCFPRAAAHAEASVSAPPRAHVQQVDR
jgi:glutathione S-transferase